MRREGGKRASAFRQPSTPSNFWQPAPERDCAGKGKLRGRFAPARPEPAAGALGGFGALRGARSSDARAFDLRRRRFAGRARASRLALGGGVLEHRVHLTAEDEDETADVERSEEHTSEL